MKTTKELLRDLGKYDGSVREERQLRIQQQNIENISKAQRRQYGEETRRIIEDMELKYGGTGPAMTYEMATRGY